VDFAQRQQHETNGLRAPCSIPEGVQAQAANRAGGVQSRNASIDDRLDIALSGNIYFFKFFNHHINLKK
jgi:hypothetical protein